MLLNLAWRGLGDDAAAQEKCGTIRNTQGLGHVVIGQDDAHPGLSLLAKELADGKSARRIQARERLVAYEKTWTGDERPPNLESPPLPPGKIPRPHLEPRQKPDPLGPDLRAERLSRWDEALESPEVVLDAEIPEHAGRLGHVAEAASRPLPQRLARDVVGAEPDPASGDLDFADEGSEQRRLPRPARADQGEHLGGGQLEIDVAQDFVRADAEGHLLGDEAFVG